MRKILSQRNFYTLRHTALGVLLFFSFSIPAYADEIDPFHSERSDWMSFDRYKESTKNDKTEEQPQAEKTNVPASAAPAANDTHFVDGSKDQVKDKGPAIAAPSRPINPPLMPGMNKDFNIQISTTEDDNKPPAAKITQMDTDPQFQIKKNWETTKEALKHMQSRKPGSDDDITPIDVRMSFLPSNSVLPIPDPATPHGTEGRPPNAAAVAKNMKQDAKDAEYAKWSAELEAYKKHQLEAIQSDRETLSALQNAVRDLGLQKQLDFMPGVNGSVGQKIDTAAQPTSLEVNAPSLTDLPKN